MTGPRRRRAPVQIPADQLAVDPSDPDKTIPASVGGDDEARYPPDASAGPKPIPLKARIQLVVVDGTEGRRLRARQAAVIREALRWFAEHQNDRTPPAAQ